MSLYEVAKDAVKLAQQLDNVELTQKLLDVQKQSLDLLDENSKLKKEIEALKEAKKFVFAENHNYLVDPASPNRALCPACTKKLCTEVPLAASGYCEQCKSFYK